MRFLIQRLKLSVFMFEHSCVCVVQGAIGALVWGHAEGFPPWPAIIAPGTGGEQRPGKRMVEWYGQRASSQVSRM